MRINEALEEMKSKVLDKGMCSICRKQSNCSRHCGHARNPGAEILDLVLIVCSQFKSR